MGLYIASLLHVLSISQTAHAYNMLIIQSISELVTSSVSMRHWNSWVDA